MTGVGALREPIRPADRADVLGSGEAACYWCEQPGADEVDHLVPVTAGGLSARTNLVPACGRCNREKSDMSVAEWIAWRAERGRCWPPPSRFLGMGELLDAIPRAEMFLVDVMFRDAPARPVPYLRWLHDWSRRVHRGQTLPMADEVAGYLAAVPTYRDDGAYFYGDDGAQRWPWGAPEPETEAEERAWLVERTAAELDAWMDGRRVGSPAELCGLMLRRRDELTPGGRAARNERELADLLAEGPSDSWPPGDGEGQHGWIVGVVRRHLAEARAEPDARRLTFEDRLRLAEIRGGVVL